MNQEFISILMEMEKCMARAREHMPKEEEKQPEPVVVEEKKKPKSRVIKPKPKEQAKECMCREMVLPSEQDRHLRGEYHKNYVKQLTIDARNTPYTCYCGAVVKNKDRTKHEATQKHSKNLKKPIYKIDLSSDMDE